VTSGVHKKEKDDITPGVCQLCTHAVASGVNILETQKTAPDVHKLDTHVVE
jgi:hypothetical protein